MVLITRCVNHHLTLIINANIFSKLDHICQNFQSLVTGIHYILDRTFIQNISNRYIPKTWSKTVNNFENIQEK